MQHKKLDDTYLKDNVYQKLHKYWDGHEKASQYVDERSTEFWVGFSSQVLEDHQQTCCLLKKCQFNMFSEFSTKVHGSEEEQGDREFSDWCPYAPQRRDDA